VTSPIVARAVRTLPIPVQRRLRRAVSKRRQPTTPPTSPVGVKLEVTGRCNLLCSFCYTDSPYRTRIDEPELSDDTWRKVVDECIDAGILEAVITGGEPFLRKSLTLELIEKLTSNNVSVVLNTNGWFVDKALAESLANIKGIRVNVSIDARDAATHDAGRGVNGSWERAVNAVDFLQSSGVPTQVNAVVMPTTVNDVGLFLRELDLFGVRDVRLSIAVETGAATRGTSPNDWFVDRRVVDREVKKFLAEKPTVLVRIAGGSYGSRVRSPAMEAAELTPRAFLVQSDGFVRTDSTNSVSYGHAPSEGVAACWTRIRENWSTEFAKQPAGMPYVDPLIPVPGSPPMLQRKASETAATPVSITRLPSGVQSPKQEHAGAESFTERAMTRRYILGPIRTAEHEGVRLVRTVGSPSQHRLNETAWFVLQNVATRGLPDVLSDLAAQFPEVSSGTLRADLLRTVSELCRKGILVRFA
jgi:MoaA/NifB/PqqE/SkfB family radical SAM enzyme